MISRKNANFKIKFTEKPVIFSAAATEERAKIVSHLSLDIGNPTVVLQQEEAKSFFRNHDPKSMYQFFEKGSLLGELKIIGLIIEVF